MNAAVLEKSIDHLLAAVRNLDAVINSDIGMLRINELAELKEGLVKILRQLIHESAQVSN